MSSLAMSDGYYMGIIDNIKELLLQIPGVIDVAQVLKKDLYAIRQAQSKSDGMQLVKLVSIGMERVLERDSIFVFIKDRSFRPPPSPTIYMVEDMSCNNAPSHECIEIDNKLYHVIGEEVLDRDKVYMEKHVFFTDCFVLFPERRKQSRNIPAYFLIPPVRFQELEAKRSFFSIKNVISVSPPTTADVYLRNEYRLLQNPEYATILVGFDNNI